MLVSIIVVTYNSSKHVTETLDSIYAQSYKDLELIISDDCSPDNTLDICREWCRNHQERFINIRIVKTPHNRGICGNYNYSLQFARGEWIKYIAGDDILCSECISTYVSATKKSDCKIFFGAVTPFSIVNNSIVKWSTRSSGKDCFEVPNPKEQLRRMLMKGAGAVEGPTLFVERQSFIRWGGVDEKYPMVEDLPLALKYASRGFPIGYIDTPTVLYREYPESVSKSHAKFSSMVNYAINDYRKKLAFAERDYISWWHSFIYSGIESSRMSDQKFRLRLFSLLKYTDICIIRSKMS